MVDAGDAGARGAWVDPVAVDAGHAVRRVRHAGLAVSLAGEAGELGGVGVPAVRAGVLADVVEPVILGRADESALLALRVGGPGADPAALVAGLALLRVGLRVGPRRAGGLAGPKQSVVEVAARAVAEFRSRVEGVPRITGLADGRISAGQALHGAVETEVIDCIGVGLRGTGVEADTLVEELDAVAAADSRVCWSGGGLDEPVRTGLALPGISVANSLAISTIRDAGLAGEV